MERDVTSNKLRLALAIYLIKGFVYKIMRIVA